VERQVRPVARVSAFRPTVQRRIHVQRKPVLVAYPRSDAAFVADVHRAAAALGDRATPEGLEFALRKNRGSVVVRPRELANEPIDVWYVFRDGHWTPDQPGEEGSAEA
jgi:hypothetical protein